MTYREVVHIKDVKGAHGGEAWVLTLECGHVAVRAKKRFHPGMVVQLAFMSVEKWLAQAYAPHRVKCWVCAEKEKEE